MHIKFKLIPNEQDGDDGKEKTPWYYEEEPLKGNLILS